MKKIPFIILLSLLASIMIYAIYTMPEYGDINAPSNNEVKEYYVENTKEDVNINNMVSAVITDYRVFDTLGEATVLFTSIVAVSGVLKSFKKKEKLEDE